MFSVFLYLFQRSLVWAAKLPCEEENARTNIGNSFIHNLYLTNKCITCDCTVPIHVIMWQCTIRTRFTRSFCFPLARINRFPSNSDICDDNNSMRNEHNLSFLTTHCGFVLFCWSRKVFGNGFVRKMVIKLFWATASNEFLFLNVKSLGQMDLPQLIALNVPWLMFVSNYKSSIIFSWIKLWNAQNR